MSFRNLQAGVKSFNGLGLNMLTRDELETLHLATLDVLRNTGIKAESREALELFAGKGADVDFRSGLVRIPAYMVEDAIRTAPSTIRLAGRKPEKDYVVEGSRVGFVNFGEGVAVIDPVTREYRKSYKKDVADAARLSDYLDDLDISYRAVTALDYDGKVQSLHNAEAIFQNTTKHFFIGADGINNCRKIIQMAAEVVGGREELRRRPIISFNVCPTSPLRLIPDCTDVIIEAARAGIPSNIISMALAGATTPVTLAGTLVTHNAEVLSAVVLSQLAFKGAPVLYGSSTTIMDLRFSTTPVGAPELGMISAGVAKLARYYMLPSFVAGGQADSKIPDAQAAHEKTITAMLAAQGGANLIYGAGMLELGVTFDFAQLMMDNEIFRMVKKVVGGIEISDAKMALEVIHEVGPGGQYVSHEHTYQNFRKEQSQSLLIDRQNRTGWLKGGGTTMTERAYEKANAILNSHTPEPLPASTVKSLRAIVEDAEKEYGVK